jgi:hypothetical protein
MKKKYKFNKKADAALTEFYKDHRAETPEQQFLAMNHWLGGETSFSHTPSVEQKVSMMEYEYLGNLGLIKLVLA